MTRRYAASSRSLAELYIALGGCGLVTVTGTWGFAGILKAAFNYGLSWYHPFFIAAPVGFIALSLLGASLLVRACLEIAVYDNQTIFFRSIVARRELPARAVRSVTRAALLPLVLKIATDEGTLIVVSGTIDHFEFFLADLKALKPSIDVRA